MQRTQEDLLLDGTGYAVIEKQLLEALTHLWDGPLVPSELGRVERCLRAIITGKTLVAARFHDIWHGPAVDYGVRGDAEVEPPFYDHLLDYEFVLPDQAQPFRYAEQEEASFLESLVRVSLAKGATSVLPEWIERKSEAFAFWDAWYRGMLPDQCEEYVRIETAFYDDMGLSDPGEPGHADFHGHPVFHGDPVDHAVYLLGCHRAGAVVYGDSPVARICSKHVFSIWPELMLLISNEEFKEAASQLREPGISFLLPPLIGVVLSLAPCRDRIPEKILELRNICEETRTKLWDLMQEMWSAKPFAEQVECLRELERASRAIFREAFPERRDVLSIALSHDQFTPSDVATAVKARHGRKNKPRARVGAVSFAERHAEDLREQLCSSPSVLRAHLTDAELRGFGLGVSPK